MDREQINLILESLLEDLARVEHERWAHWQRYMHSRGIRNSDGSLTLPPELVFRWEEQIAKSYEELSLDEKESDREQVRKYLPLISSALAAGKCHGR